MTDHETIREALLDSGMLHSELAQGLGCSQPAVSDLLTGKKPISGARLIAMHDVIVGGDARASILAAIRDGVPLP